MRSPGRRLRRIAAVAILLGLVGFGAAACGGGSDGGASNAGALVDALPGDGELGAGWVRISEPRVGDGAEASTICGVQLNVGMIDGAKIDLANDREDFVSTFFRRYTDAETARQAFGAATEKIASCPSNGVESDAAATVSTIPAPEAGDAAYGAVFNLSATDSRLAEEFGWTLVRTDDVIRSLQYFPTESRATTGGDLRALAEAVATTE